MVLRSCRVAGDANSMYSLCGIRMMSGVSRSKSASSAPWALLPCMHICCGKSFIFYSLAEKDVYNAFVTRLEYYYALVGSSQGWLSFYDDEDHQLFLADPLANRVIELPPLKDTVVHSVVPGEDGRLALATYGDDGGSNLALFSRRRSSSGWIPLVNPSLGEKKRVYDGVVYRSRDKRVFCITSDAEEDNSKLELECWDLESESESPRVRETMEIDLGYPLVKETRKLKYLVLAEHSGEMYVVVRHVASRDDNKFDVYKIEKGRAVRMEDSLEGLAMFMGNNQALALPAEEHSGLNPNCLYFSVDQRLYSKRHQDGMAGKMFDYQKREISPLPSYSYEYTRGDHITWFVPSPT